MNIDLMRKVDYWCGVPLCFITSIILWVINFIADVDHETTQNPKKILFIELSEMGSAILADPAMRKISRESGGEIFFVIFYNNRHSLQLMATVPQNNIFTIRSDNIINLAIDSFMFLKWCRANSIDTVIDLELFSRFSALLTGLSGAKKKVGFFAFHNEGLYRGFMLTHKVSYNPHIHISKNFLSLVYSAMQNKDELPYAKVHFTDDEIKLAEIKVEEKCSLAVREKIRIILENKKIPSQNFQIILINANGSDLLPQRRWSLENYQQLIINILTHYENNIVLLTGAPSEKKYVQTLSDLVANSRCINFAGKVEFTELPALYSISKIMVTNDSGAAHFASTTSLPTFVLFGPETPALYGALGNFYPITANLACSPCVSAWNHRKTPCSEPRCMSAISVDEVFEKIKSYI